MSSYLSRPAYSPLALNTGSDIQVRATAMEASRISSIAEVANFEVAQVGLHAVNAMAGMTYGSEAIRRQLTYAGYGNEGFDDGRDKLVQVTGTNLITVANTAQKQIVQIAAEAMRR